jgi:hypothetical protein
MVKNEYIKNVFKLGEFYILLLITAIKQPIIIKFLFDVLLLVCLPCLFGVWQSIFKTCILNFVKVNLNIWEET